MVLCSGVTFPALKQLVFQGPAVAGAQPEVMRGRPARPRNFAGCPPTSGCLFESWWWRPPTAAGLPSNRRLGSSPTGRVIAPESMETIQKIFNMAHIKLMRLGLTNRIVDYSDSKPVNFGLIQNSTMGSSRWSRFQSNLDRFQPIFNQFWLKDRKSQLNDRKSWLKDRKSQWNDWKSQFITKKLIKFNIFWLFFDINWIWRSIYGLNLNRNEQIGRLKSDRKSWLKDDSNLI